MLFWKSKVVLAKLETVYGTDAVPTGAANAILALNVSLAPMEGQDVKRELERPYMGARPSLPVGLTSVLTFDVELVGGGSLGVAPAWGPLLRMCGVAQVLTAGSKVEYTPITDNQESGSLYFQISGTRHVLLGSRGTAMLKVNAQGIPVLSFTLTGLFTTPAEAAAIVPVYTAFQSPQVATKANTPTFLIGAVSFNLRDFQLDLACDVQPRLLIGQEQILIVDKDETVKATIEAVPVTTYNPYLIAQNSTPQVIQMIHGTVAGRKVQVDIPVALQSRLTGYENNQNIAEWPLSFSPQPVLGNDQWKISIL